MRLRRAAFVFAVGPLAALLQWVGDPLSIDAVAWFR
jgi:hypothetical protein